MKKFRKIIQYQLLVIELALAINSISALVDKNYTYAGVLALVFILIVLLLSRYGED